MDPFTALTLPAPPAGLWWALQRPLAASGHRGHLHLRGGGGPVPEEPPGPRGGEEFGGEGRGTGWGANLHARTRPPTGAARRFRLWHGRTRPAQRTGQEAPDGRRGEGSACTPQTSRHPSPRTHPGAHGDLSRRAGYTAPVTPTLPASAVGPPLPDQEGTRGGQGRACHAGLGTPPQPGRPEPRTRRTMLFLCDVMFLSDIKKDVIKHST